MRWLLCADSRTNASEEKTITQEAHIPDLIESITIAFKDVVLGNGVGLFEAQAIDDYCTEPEQLVARARDEKMDWTAISHTDLNRCYSSLSFFDKEGMRFHLPAFLIAELKGEFQFDIWFHLTHLSEYKELQFELLNTQQRLVVSAVLQFKYDLQDDHFYHDHISIALNGYWNADNEQ